MTPEAVRGILGEPDDIIRHRIRPYDDYSDSQTWRYGSVGPDTCATLGTVRFDQKDKSDLYEQRPFDPRDLPDEATLRKAMRLLDRTVRNFDSFEGEIDPLAEIRAANFLIGLGEAKAKAVLREHYRVGNGMSVALARILLEPPDPPGFLAVPAIGGISPEPPKDLGSAPFYPFGLYDDIPVSLYEFVTLGGVPEAGYWHFLRVSKGARFRSRPLSPGTDPLRIFAEAARLGDPWKSEGIQYRLQIQLRRLYRTVLPMGSESLAMDWNRPYRSDDAKKLSQDLAALKVTWNASEGVFTFFDGTVLPPPERMPVYDPDAWVGWAPPELKEDKVFVELQGPSHGQVMVTFRYVTRRALTKNAFALSILNETGMTLFNLRSPNEDLPVAITHNSESTSTSIFLKKGERVRPRLTYQGKVYEGPWLVPSP